LRRIKGVLMEKIGLPALKREKKPSVFYVGRTEDKSRRRKALFGMKAILLTEVKTERKAN